MISDSVSTIVRRFALPCVVVAVAVFCPAAIQADDSATSPQQLAAQLTPFLKALAGAEPKFEISGRADVVIDGQPQSVQLRMTRFDDECFDLALTHTDYAVEIQRRASWTAMILPKHNVAFVGSGSVPKDLQLSPLGLTSRLVSRYSKAMLVTAAIQPGLFEAVGPMLHSFLTSRNAASSGEKPISLTFPQPGSLNLAFDGNKLHLSVRTDITPPSNEQPDLPSVQLTRQEVEQTLLRGVHRATEILWPGMTLTNPSTKPRKVPHGELRFIEGQRVAILHGTPEEIGTAHGQLLKDEATRCIESVLYSFGTAHAIRTGHWFRHDLKAAYKRLSPHIPERHKRETQALALALDVPGETLEFLNVFPEMFHCSGFAVFGSATKDGRLYHGRVLDYMTTIGLQDAATTFIVRPENYAAFANVGYAAFIGSVTGMNDRAISLGEMGGRGEGNWDGVPMATLMRRALEECSTLDEVIQLWTDSPRTCEYYYVFADGKTNQAVGVAALPESIEFIKPGESHERLGEGIADSVVLSAGSRLEELRRRVTEKHGQIDADTAIWLMSRPVAMQSNLHNVLFIPETGILHVANASHSRPAAEQPYVELNLKALLASSPSASEKPPAVSQLPVE